MSDCTKCGNQRRHVCDNCDPIADSDETNARILALEAACRVLAAEAYWSRTWEDSHFEDTDEPVTVPHGVACVSKDKARIATDDNPTAAKFLEEARNG